MMQQRIKPEQALEKLIADAGQFQQVRAVLEQWLKRHDIYIAEYHGWHVALGSRQWAEKRLKKESFPTLSQALTFALSEAERRIASSEPVQPERVSINEQWSGNVSEAD